ncbi:MAG TPA: DMT family transporter [Candidatus Obscuribacterales bacterium]
MTALLIALMLAAGACSVTQIAVNARLREAVESPIAATLISIMVSALVLIPILSAGLWGRGRFDNLQALPWWAWIGGACGAFFLVANIVSIPRLGAALTVACALVGQVIAAMLIDSFGLFGVPKTLPNPYRMCGAAMLVLGVVLLQRK